MENVKKRNELLLTLCILFIIFQTASIIIDAIDCGSMELSWTMSCVCAAIVNVCLYISYRRHVKNVMKPLMGASLILLLTYEMSAVSNLIEGAVQYGTAYADAFGGMHILIIYCIINVLLFMTIASINVVHYLINSTHKSNLRLIKLNNILFIFYVLMICCRLIIFISGESIGSIISSIVGAIADIFTIGIVIIIEQSLDEFKAAREIYGGNRR